jgi:hypothetical protein
MKLRSIVMLAAVVLVGITCLGPATSSMQAAPKPRDTEPRPIPGGDFIPFGVIHQYVPGPIGVHPLTEGVDVEPNGLTDFRGFIAMAFVAGTATDAAGIEYHLESDIRVYQGEYVSLDGTHHRGTFVEI